MGLILPLISSSPSSFAKPFWGLYQRIELPFQQCCGLDGFNSSSYLQFPPVLLLCPFGDCTKGMNYHFNSAVVWMGLILPLISSSPSPIAKPFWGLYQRHELPFQQCCGLDGFNSSSYLQFPQSYCQALLGTVPKAWTTISTVLWSGLV